MMKSQRMTHGSLVGSLIAAVGGTVLLMPLTASAEDDEAVATAQRQLLDKYCITCHNYTDNAGGIMPTRSFFSMRSVTLAFSCGTAGS